MTPELILRFSFNNEQTMSSPSFLILPLFKTNGDPYKILSLNVKKMESSISPYDMSPQNRISAYTYANDVDKVLNSNIGFERKQDIDIYNSSGDKISKLLGCRVISTSLEEDGPRTMLNIELSFDVAIVLEFNTFIQKVEKEIGI